MLPDGSGFRVARFLTATVLLVCEVIIAITINALLSKALSTDDVTVSATSAATNLPSPSPLSLFNVGVDGVMTTYSSCFSAERVGLIGIIRWIAQ